MRAEIISVGTELLLGQIVDTNAAHLSRLLPELGIDLYYRSTVGDNFERIVDALRLALSRADIVFTIGGLGPTEDDLTKEAVAEAMGIEMVVDEDSARRIREFFAARGIEMPERNLKQALAPKEGRIIPNEVGTAPGAIFERDGKAVITLPGPPGEFTAMVENGVLPYLRGRGGAVPALIKSRVLKIAGLGESAVEDRVRDLLHGQNPSVAPLAHLGEVHLRITAKAEDAPTADRLIRESEEKLRERLGDFIFGADDETLEQVVVEMLIEKGLKLGLGESCTGGLLANRITNVPGASNTLVAGIVAYSNEAKSKFLEVPTELIEKHGAVSHEVARAMASGAREVAGADIGIGITGIAGPGGGTPVKPVGLVHIALSTEDDVASVEHRFAGSRIDIKARSAQATLTMLRRHLLGAGGQGPGAGIKRASARSLEPKHAQSDSSSLIAHRSSLAPDPRLFIAVLISDDLKRRIALVQEGFKKVAPKVKWVAEENFHVTLKFLGNVESSRLDAITEALAEAVEDAAPFDIEIGGAGAFPNPGRPRVIWTGITAGKKELAELAERVEKKLESLGFPREDRPFRAHITIGRVKEGFEAKNLGPALREAETGALGSVRVDSIALMKSELRKDGSVYSVISEVKLQER